MGPSWGDSRESRRHTWRGAISSRWPRPRLARPFLARTSAHPHDNHESHTSANRYSRRGPAERCRRDCHNRGCVDLRSESEARSACRSSCPQRDRREFRRDPILAAARHGARCPVCGDRALFEYHRSVNVSPGGQPSTTQPMAGPWLSPNDVTEKSVPNVFPAITRDKENQMNCVGAPIQ